MRQAAVERLQEGAVRLGLEMDADLAGRFVIFRDELLAWNLRQNLTSIVDSDEVLERHFLDSLAGWPFAGLEPDLAALDLGSGGGFPGLPLRLYGGAQLPSPFALTVMDAARKKLDFVRHLCERLGLTGVRIVHARAEEAGRLEGYREVFGRVLTRAVAPLPVLAEYVLPFLSVGGRWVAWLGPSAREEIKRAESAIERLGGEATAPLELQLPFSGAGRLLFSVEKVRPTPERYPRRPGVPSRKPLT